MGFVSVATLLKVQNSLRESDLGVATSSQQFARTLGGTIGIGFSGAMVSHYYWQGGGGCFLDGIAAILC